MSKDQKFLVWVSEEDTLRIISMERGGDILRVFSRLTGALHQLEDSLPFVRHGSLGLLSSCPTNLGTAMRASVHVKLENLGQAGDLKLRCDKLGLSVHGEHSESEGGVHDISNKARLGVTEAEVASNLAEGVSALISEERKA